MAHSIRLEETRPTGNGRSRGLVSSRESGRRVEARGFAPSADLADVVECLWIGRWDLTEPHVTELIPDPCVHLVVEGGDRDEARVVGVWTRRWTRTLSGRGFVRGAKLRAGAFRSFFDEPAHLFSNRITPINLRLRYEEDVDALLELESLLRARRREATRAGIELVAQISSDPEITSVETLATKTNTHRRVLQRIFREHVGASPKWVIRVRRLQEAAMRIERCEIGLAALAAELGYADQAHLARDFKSVVGKTPTEFARLH
jgi:AraC-like DNA-binding protein